MERRWLALGWLLPNLIVVGASFFHGMTGFGFGIVALPFMIIFHDPHESVIVCTFLGMINVIKLAVKTRESIRLKTVRRITLFSLPGLPLGGYVFAHFDVGRLKALISTLTVLFGLFLLSKWVHQFRREKLAESVVGFLAGFFQTSVGLSGIPPAIYLTLQGYEKDRFRASINAMFLAVTGVGLLTFFFVWGVSREVLLLGFSLIPAVLVGQWVGARLSGRVSQSLFNKIVTLGIVGSGLYNLARLVGE